MKQSSKFILGLLFSAAFSILLAQAAEESTSSGGIDWFQLMFEVGYLLGVFVLLPLVIYTNLNEKLFDPTSDDKNLVQPLSELSEEERNDRALKILERISEKLTPFTGENGEELITITNGLQAKFMKRGLDYINKKLVPTDPEIITRINELKGVYEDRTKRVFTGSNWIIGCSVFVGLFMVYTAGINTFIFIHALGLLFYILSSRTTMYGVERRIKMLGGGSNVVGGIMGGLFLGNGTKYYVKHGSGPWKRDYDTEFQMGMIGLVIMFVIALFLGFLAVVLGVVNFVINYSTSFLIPFKNEEQWYEKNFVQVSV